MKILVICQHYYPELFRITDICEQLKSNGHCVDVLTGLPNYPHGKLYAGYSFKNKIEIINGIKVHRCLTIPRKNNLFYRILNYISFAFFSTNYIKKMDDIYDVVFVNQLSPVLMASAGVWYTRKYGKRLVLYCLDLWPESLLVGGIKKNGIIYKCFKKISRKIYMAADSLLISSKSFSQYFVENLSIDEKKINYLPQYAEDLFLPDETIEKNTIDLMFAGNIGYAQSVKTIVEVAALTQDIKNLIWHIVGAGSELENCKALAKKLGILNIVFYGQKDLKEMPRYYAMADAMLVTMKKDAVTSFTLPGKVQSYMAAGKPIIGAVDGETAWVIENAECGYYCKPEDPSALEKSVRLFVDNIHKNSFGKKAREYYEKNFSKEKFFKVLETEFYKI